MRLHVRSDKRYGALTGQTGKDVRLAKGLARCTNLMEVVSKQDIEPLSTCTRSWLQQFKL